MINNKLTVIPSYYKVLTREDLKKELIHVFQLIKDNPETYERGLCEALRRTISNKFLHTHCLEIMQNFFKKTNKRDGFLIGYWWPVDDKESRVEFLDSLINHLKK